MLNFLMRTVNSFSFASIEQKFVVNNLARGFITICSYAVTETGPLGEGATANNFVIGMLMCSEASASSENK